MTGTTIREDRLRLRVRAYRELAGAVVRGPCERVLALCSGTGLDAAVLAEQLGSDGTIVALDREPRSLAAAAQRLRRFPVHSAAVVGDARDPAVRRGRFDVVVCAFGLHYFADPGTVLRSWAGLLRPGGRIGLTLWGTPEPAEVFTWSVPDPDLPGEVRWVRGDIRYSGLSEFAATLPSRPELVMQSRMDGAPPLRDLCDRIGSAARRHWGHRPPIEVQPVAVALLERDSLL